MLPTQNTIRDLLGYIAFEIDQARSDLEKWGAWFNQNPHAALMGASHAMGYAAQLKLWTEIQELAEPHRKDGLCYNDLCRTLATYLHDDMLGKARHPSSSSLQSANLMSQADLTAVSKSSPKTPDEHSSIRTLSRTPSAGEQDHEQQARNHQHLPTHSRGADVVGGVLHFLVLRQRLPHAGNPRRGGHRVRAG